MSRPVPPILSWQRWRLPLGLAAFFMAIAVMSALSIIIGELFK